MFVFRDLIRLQKVAKNTIKLPEKLLSQTKIRLSLNKERTYEKFDFEYNANFYDNGSIVGHKANTIVAIHGTPGAAVNFARLFKTMTEKGVRVIVPEMPGKCSLKLKTTFKRFTNLGFDVIKATNFAYKQQTHQRSQFVDKLLDQLQLNQINCLVGHSSGTWVLAKLWSENRIKIKSLALLHPTWNRPKQSEPSWIRENYCILCSRTSSGRLLFSLTNKPLGVITNEKMRVVVPTDLCYTASYCAHYTNKQEVSRQTDGQLANYRL